MDQVIGYLILAGAVILWMVYIYMENNTLTCPHCGNDDKSMISIARTTHSIRTDRESLIITYLCTVCSKEFQDSYNRDREKGDL